MRAMVYKTLSINMIYSPMSPPSLLKPLKNVKLKYGTSSDLYVIPTDLILGINIIKPII